MPRRREGETIQTPPNFVRLHLKGVGGVTVEKLCQSLIRVVGLVCGARRGEGGKKRRKVHSSKRVSSYLALNGIFNSSSSVLFSCPGQLNR